MVHMHKFQIHKFIPVFGSTCVFSSCLAREGWQLPPASTSTPCSSREKSCPPSLRLKLGVLATAGFLVLSAAALAGERPVALADPPAAVEPGATRIVIDEQAGAVQIIIDGHERAIFNGSGLHVSGSIDYTGTLTDVSDLRLKTDIRPLGSALPKIGALQPVTFRMKDNPAQQEYGLLAQQVEEIYPALVETRTDDTKGVNYVGLIAPLIVAVQQLHADNRVLQADNLALRDRITALEHSVNARRGEAP